MLRFSYRIIPKLPPKRLQVIVNSEIVEDRRRCLQRFLNFIVSHPAMKSDVIVKYFLSEDARVSFLFIFFISLSKLFY